MAQGAQSTYQQSGPSAPQTARAVLAELPGQVRGFGNVPAFITQNGVRVQARASGSGGEAITVTFVAAGASTPLTVTVSTNAITVNLATDAAGNSVSTARQVADAINTTAASQALVASAVTTGDGSQVVGAATVQSLAGDVAANVGVESYDAPLPKQPPIKNHYA